MFLKYIAMEGGQIGMERYSEVTPPDSTKYVWWPI